MTYRADYEDLGRGPILPPDAPLPHGEFCPVIGRKLLWAPRYDALDTRGKCVAFDYYFCGHDNGYREGFRDGYLKGREDEAEELAALQRQAAAIAHDVRPSYWELSERRGEPERAQKALQRAKQKGYYL